MIIEVIAVALGGTALVLVLLTMVKSLEIDGKVDALGVRLGWFRKDQTVLAEAISEKVESLESLVGEHRASHGNPASAMGAVVAAGSIVAKVAHRLRGRGGGARARRRPPPANLHAADTAVQSALARIGGDGDGEAERRRWRWLADEVARHDQQLLAARGDGRRLIAVVGDLHAHRHDGDGLVYWPDPAGGDDAERDAEFKKRVLDVLTREPWSGIAAEWDRIHNEVYGPRPRSLREHVDVVERAIHSRLDMRARDVRELEASVEELRAALATHEHPVADDSA